MYSIYVYIDVSAIFISWVKTLQVCRDVPFSLSALSPRGTRWRRVCAPGCGALVTMCGLVKVCLFAWVCVSNVRAPVFVLPSVVFTHHVVKRLPVIQCTFKNWRKTRFKATEAITYLVRFSLFRCWFKKKQKNTSSWCEGEQEMRVHVNNVENKGLQGENMSGKAELRGDKHKVMKCRANGWEALQSKMMNKHDALTWNCCTRRERGCRGDDFKTFRWIINWKWRRTVW